MQIQQFSFTFDENKLKFDNKILQVLEVLACHLDVLTKKLYLIYFDKAIRVLKGYRFNT